MKKNQESSFSHLDQRGRAVMVDVGGKPVQHRRAVAAGEVICKRSTILALRKKALPKGDVLSVARIAAIQAVKQTPALIPLCHPLPIHQVGVEFKVKADRVEIFCEVKTEGKTGVEMEALTGVSVAALAIYDMCKAVDKTMVIGRIRVLEKVKL